MVPIVINSLELLTSAVPWVILKVGMLSAWAAIARTEIALRKITHRSFGIEEPPTTREEIYPFS
jgi:hypothetical protein